MTKLVEKIIKQIVTKTVKNNVKILKNGKNRGKYLKLGGS